MATRPAGIDTDSRRLLIRLRLPPVGPGEGLSTALVTPYDGPMLWNKNGGSLEIRTRGELADGRPALDEIVADGASIHLEQMSHDQWFMGIEAGGKYFHLNFPSQLRDERR